MNDSREAKSPLKPQSSLFAEAPFDAAIVAGEPADVLADALFECRLPRHELKADSVVNHGEAAGGEIDGTSKPATDVFPGLGFDEAQSALGRHHTADANDLGLLEALEEVARSADQAIRPPGGKLRLSAVLGANDQATAEAVSKSLGRRTVRYKTESRTIELMGLHRRTKVEQLRERDLLMPQEVRQLPSEKMLVLVEGQNPILADKIRFFATKLFREIEAFARSHVPFVPASEFLPPQPVPATTQAYANAGEAGEVSSTQRRSALPAGTSPGNGESEGLARGMQTMQAIEARFDSAARRLKTLAIRSRTPQIRRGVRDWSAIFDETVPDAGPELGLETA